MYLRADEPIDIGIWATGLDAKTKSRYRTHRLNDLPNLRRRFRVKEMVDAHEKTTWFAHGVGPVDEHRLLPHVGTLVRSSAQLPATMLSATMLPSAAPELPAANQRLLVACRRRARAPSGARGQLVASLPLIADVA
jgi:hypothetical protein